VTGFGFGIAIAGATIGTGADSDGAFEQISVELFRMAVTRAWTARSRQTCSKGRGGGDEVEPARAIALVLEAAIADFAEQRARAKAFLASPLLRPAASAQFDVLQLVQVLQPAQSEESARRHFTKTLHRAHRDRDRGPNARSPIWPPATRSSSGNSIGSNAACAICSIAEMLRPRRRAAIAEPTISSRQLAGQEAHAVLGPSRTRAGLNQVDPGCPRYRISLFQDDRSRSTGRPRKRRTIRRAIVRSYPPPGRGSSPKSFTRQNHVCGVRGSP
jgi:hypothetical protein